MPLQKLQFRPGVNREGTNYSNEGGFYECDKIRFRSGYPEKLGGWQSISPYTYVGTNRNMWNWVTLDGANLNAVGTSQKLYVEYGGLYNDITPIRQTTTTLGAPTGPFTTTNGSPLVEVTHTSHGATVNSFVSFSGASAVGGLTISGEYEIVAVPSANTYNIVAASNATSSATGGGATVTATYYLNAGLSTSVSGTGWGAGGWSRGGWGSGAAVSVSNQLALWSLDNYGEDMVCCQRGGVIYYWDTNTVTFPRATALSDVANSTVLYTTTATSGGAGTTITVASANGLGPGMVVSGTNVVAGTYITTAYTPGSTTVTLSASTTGAASGSYTFSYAGRFVPNATYQVLTSDIQRFAICFGSNPYDPTNFTTTFDPMLVRWSDQENIYQWVPAVTNQAGEQRLSHGSSIITAKHTRQETLIWTDSGLFSMQYIGPPYVFGFSTLADNISIISPNCVAVANNITYWMGVDKFYTYAGRVETLPCSLRQYVFQNLNKSQAYQIVCGTNEAYNEIWWFYPSLNSPTNDSYVIYNYLERIWYYGSLRRTAWLDSPLRSYPMAAFSVQNTYLASNITSTDTQIPVLNSSAYPSTGTIQIGSEKITYTSVNANAFYGCTRGVEGTTAASHNAYAAVTYTIANQVMYHEVGVDDASTDMPTAIEAFIQSSDFDIGDGHNFGFVWRMIPDLTFSGSTTTNPTATLTVRPRQFSGSNYGVANDPSVTRTATYPVEQYTGQVYTRLRGRQMAFKISSTGLGVTWQLGTPRIDIRNDGRR